VYENWVPDGDIKCLFIGESPPGRGIFFYDSSSEGPFRRNLLNILQINKSGYEGLYDFKNRDFLLIDVLKCRVNKRGKSIPKLVVINNCLEIFKFKVELLSKINAKKFVILGNAALKALGMMGFRELNEYSVTKDCEETLKSHGFEIFLCTLPFAGTKKYWNTVQVKGVEVFHRRRIVKVKRNKLSEEVKKETIYVYEEKYDKALETLRHEFSDYAISQVIEPYKRTANQLILLINEIAYKKKEELVEKTTKLI
jgi:hypothetical protein